MHEKVLATRDKLMHHKFYSLNLEVWRLLNQISPWCGLCTYPPWTKSKKCCSFIEKTFIFWECPCFLRSTQRPRNWHISKMTKKVLTKNSKMKCPKWWWEFPCTNVQGDLSVNANHLKWKEWRRWRGIHFYSWHACIKGS